MAKRIEKRSKMEEAIAYFFWLLRFLWFTINVVDRERVEQKYFVIEREGERERGERARVKMREREKKEHFCI